MPSVINQIIDFSIQSINNLTGESEDNLSLISKRLIYTQSKKALPNFIKRIKSIQNLEDIEKIRNIIYYVNIDGDYHFHITLSLIKNGQLNTNLISSSISLKIGNVHKNVNYTLYV